MTNDSIEQVLEAGKKRKPNNRTLEKELGVHWGLMKGKSNQKGVGNPKGYPGPANTQQIPSGLEPAQEEQKV